jgi:hypothetical protein
MSAVLRTLLVLAGVTGCLGGLAYAPGPDPVTYSVQRDGADAGGNCPNGSPPENVITCTDSGLAIGTHTYTVTAKWRSWSETSSPLAAKVTLGLPADHFAITAASSSPGVGVADNLTITALDENENTVTTYTGSHNLTFSGASKSPIGTAPTVINGTGTATAFGSATGTLTIASTGPAVSSAGFTYTSKSAAKFNDKITAAKLAGTAYTSAPAETSR